MNTLIEFIKTTLLGGVVVLIPVLLFYLLFDEMLEVLVALASPIMEFLPTSLAESIDSPLTLSLILLLVCAFLAGLALRSIRLKSIGSWVENTVLNRLPIYKAVKRLSDGLLGSSTEGAFSCGVIELTPGVHELVYIIEDNGNGLITVLVPLAPTGFNGPLKILEEDKVRRIDATIGAASVPISEWGVGLQQLVAHALPSSDGQSLT